MRRGHAGPVLKAIFSLLIRAGRYVGILIIEYRTAQALAYLAQRLPMMSDSELAKLGIRREEIPQHIQDRDACRKLWAVRQKPDQRSSSLFQDFRAKSSIDSTMEPTGRHSEHLSQRAQSAVLDPSADATN